MVTNMETEPSGPFPGQVDRIEFNIEQVKCLASVGRSDVFWSISGRHPMSIAEIAQSLDRPASSTTYHVNELARVGLILHVGQRQVKNRHERLYLAAARSFMHLPTNCASIEYREQTTLGLLALTRSIGREIEAFGDAIEIDPELRDFRILRQFNFKISRERSLEFKRRVSELLLEFGNVDDAEGVRVRTVLFLSPTIGESRARARKRWGKR